MPARREIATPRKEHGVRKDGTRSGGTTASPNTTYASGRRMGRS